MRDREPAAQLTAPGFLHNLPLEAVDSNAVQPDVTWLNGHAQIDLPIGVTQTGQSVMLRITDPQKLGQLVYRAMLAQARLAQALLAGAL